MSRNPQITVEEILEHGQQPGFKRELLRDAAAIIDGIPDKQFDMDDVYQDIDRKNPRDCGTVCCAIGWLSLHPGFKKLGLTPAPKSTNYYLAYKGKPIDYEDAGAQLFGISRQHSHFLFRPLDLADWKAPTPHKEVFRNRVMYLLKLQELLDAEQQQLAADSQG